MVLEAKNIDKNVRTNLGMYLLSGDTKMYKINKKKTESMQKSYD